MTCYFLETSKWTLNHFEMNTESLWNEHRITLKWTQNHFEMNTESLWNEHRITSKWTQNHLEINTESLWNEHRITSKWTQNHFEMNTESLWNEHRITLKWTQNHFEMNTESLRNEHRISLKCTSKGTQNHIDISTESLTSLLSICSMKMYLNLQTQRQHSSGFAWSHHTHWFWIHSFYISRKESWLRNISFQAHAWICWGKFVSSLEPLARLSVTVSVVCDSVGWLWHCCLWQPSLWQPLMSMTTLVSTIKLQYSLVE